MTDEITGKTRIFLDFNTPQAAAGYVSWLRSLEKLGPELDVVEYNAANDAPEVCSISHLFMLVPKREEHHGASLFELVTTPDPVAEEVPAVPSEPMPEAAHGLTPPTSAAPF